MIRTARGRCKECYACVRVCPVKAIRVERGQAEIDAQRCITCGQCLSACAQGVISAADDIARVSDLLASGRRVIAILASEHPASFYPHPFQGIRNALFQLGFHAVEESLLAEELVAREYQRFLGEEHTRPLVRSTCPAIVNWVSKYFPQLSEELIPIVSPMIAAGRLAKEFYGDVATVYVGPCVAQKTEARDDQVGDAIDVVLTFAELRSMLEEEGVALSQRGASEGRTTPDTTPGEGEPRPRAQRLELLRLASLPGGFPRAAVAGQRLVSREIRVVRGIQEARELAAACEREDVSPRLIDVLCCDGCVDGPAIDSRLNVFARKNVIETHYEQRLQEATRQLCFEDVAPELPYVRLRRTFTPGTLDLVLPTEEELRKMLATGEMLSLTDELDCGACGYASCREQAKAIYQGMAEWRMCFPFQRRLLLRAIEQLRESSVKDGLTGLANHKSLMERLAAEFHRARRYGSPLSVIMMDIDLFKGVNDSYGHVQGDQMLTVIAEVIKANIRQADFPARYGGDEFVLLLPETDKAEAFAVGEKLRRRVEETAIPLDTEAFVTSTVSLGISSLRPHMKTPAVLLEKADAALYRAKEAGRNRTFLAADVPS